MRIGIFGGTFDPVHLGHLMLAEQSREQAKLDEVWFVPAARPPQKRNQTISPFDRRVEMLQLAIAGQPQFRVDRIESTRPGPSYTTDTLSALATAYPDHEWFLIVGGDCIADFPTWYQPAQILTQATLLVIERPGIVSGTIAELLTTLKLPTEAMRGWQSIAVPMTSLASRDLRTRAKEGRSLRYLVPAAVEIYIRERGLYRDEIREVIPT